MATNHNRRPNSERAPALMAFVIEARVKIDLDINLALELGDFITDNNPTNPALLALGRQLRDLLPPGG